MEWWSGRTIGELGSLGDFSESRNPEVHRPKRRTQVVEREITGNDGQ